MSLLLNCPERSYQSVSQINLKPGKADSKWGVQTSLSVPLKYQGKTLLELWIAWSRNVAWAQFCIKEK